jgi:predicted lactoylglutathione lyase
MAAFYEAMGLKRHRASATTSTFFQMGGAILGALSPTRMPRKRMQRRDLRRRPVSRVYLAYNTRSDAEVDDVLAEAETMAGGRIVKPAGRAFWGGWYGYFADPEGNFWEVAHNPDFPIDAEGRISLPA